MAGEQELPAGTACTLQIADFLCKHYLFVYLFVGIRGNHFTKYLLEQFKQTRISDTHQETLRKE